MSFNVGSPDAPVLVSFASLTDVGRQRQLNQDSLLCQLLQPAHLVAAVEGAHELVRATAGRHRLRDMGTTATAVLIRGDRALVGQVGDSRAYLLRAGQLRQLTRDQSLAQQMVEVGQLRPGDRRSFEHGSIPWVPRPRSRST